ncbi:hypothetical protein ACFYPA_17460 [Streptomyces sp. NPDC005775]|uniref:hypothetical protein n=1 Tax=unclassified Streptomyces TaxID=2593676 RepID=UPI0033F78ECA
MSAPTQHDEVRTVYLRCRLGKSELNRLFNQAAEGISANSVVVSTQRDSSRYSANSLADLVDHVRSSNASGDLDAWGNLAFEADDGTGARKITIKADTERVEVQVSGHDATWVHGQGARIELLLKGADGRIAGDPAVREARKRSFLIAVLSFIASATAIFVGIPFQKEQYPLVEFPLLWIQLGTMAALLGLFAVSSKIIKRANRAVLAPTTEVSHGSWWSRASSADKIALSALVFTVGSFIIAAATLGKDFMK